MRALALGTVVLFITGCAGLPKNHEMTSEFSPEQAQYIKAEGRSSVSGEAFMKTKGGDVKTAAGNEISLVPVTDYSTERISVLYGENNTSFRAVNFDETDPDYLKFTRNTTAGSRGDFEFSNVPAGAYFVTASVSWSTFHGYTEITQGGAICSYVELEEGEHEEVVLSPRQESCVPQ